MHNSYSGASHCEVTLFQAGGIDKLEARNYFTSLAARDAFVSKLSPPNQQALAGMGVTLSTHVGTVVTNTLTPSALIQHSASAPVAAAAVGGVSVTVQPNKASWPELKGTPSAAALGLISGQRPDVKAMLIPAVILLFVADNLSLQVTHTQILQART